VAYLNTFAMKKIILFSIHFIGLAAIAQIPEDALKYSFYPQAGTARNLAIGGAMGSLGGDINATYVNPAGLGFYKTNEFVFSPAFLFNNNKITYRDEKNSTQKNNFNLGTSGWVFGYANRYRPKVFNAISFAVTQTANFNNRIIYKGLNNYSSFSEQFAEEFSKSGLTITQVLNVNSSLPYGSAIALNTYLIDTVRVNGKLQVKAAPEFILDAGQAIKQEYEKNTKGGIIELAMGFAKNIEDKLYVGATIGLPIVNYKSETFFKESDTSNRTNNNFKSLSYTEDVSTKGVGLNLKLGIIYKPQEQLRLGLAVHTPTYMSLTDKRTTTLATQLENPVASFFETSNTFTNGVQAKNEYVQLTPFKAMASASYVFREIENTKKQRAFITADVEFVNHRGGRFYASDDNATEGDKNYYKQLGKVIQAQYKGAFNFKVGGELKFNTIMGRLGFAYYGNPYKEAELKANRMLLSGGLGYRNKGVFVDVTYVHAISKDVDFAYRLQDRANTYASLKQQRGNVMATIGLKF
jgi:hypothetical protein